MTTKIRQGQFEVIDSFAIRKRNEFYLIGNLKEGTVQENWLVNVPVNRSIALTVRITAIEEIEISSEKNKYKLLIVSGDEETLDWLLALKISSEYLDIIIEGEN
jgi:tmRNA-binding protein